MLCRTLVLNVKSTASCPRLAALTGLQYRHLQHSSARTGIRPANMSQPTTLLVTGLTMEYSKSLSPEMDTVRFGKMLEASMATLDGVPNLDNHRFDLDPREPDDSPASTESLMKVLRAGPPQGGHWDAHLIGAGVRRIPQLAELLEDIVNTAVTASGGRSKFLFSATGGDHWDVVKRGFPELGMGEKPKPEQ